LVVGLDVVSFGANREGSFQDGLRLLGLHESTVLAEKVLAISGELVVTPNLLDFFLS
jgi:hypothetical protein